MNSRGMTLLEVLVALVIMSLTGVATLQVFGNASRAAHREEEWSQAVFLAEEGLERAKVGGAVEGTEQLAPYTRRTRVSPWRDGLVVIAVEVTLPGGGTLDLWRVAESP